MIPPSNTGQPQQRPILDGIPVTSQPVPWGWNFYQIGRDDSTAEAVWMPRLGLPTGPGELWAGAGLGRCWGVREARRAAAEGGREGVKTGE